MMAYRGAGKPDMLSFRLIRPGHLMSWGKPASHGQASSILDDRAASVHWSGQGKVYASDGTLLFEVTYYLGVPADRATYS